MRRQTEIQVFGVPAGMFMELGGLYPSGEYHLDNPYVRTFSLEIELANVRVTYFEEDA